MIKTKRGIVLIFCLLGVLNIYSQIDTIFYSNSYHYLNFNLSDETNSTFEVKVIDIKIEKEDTVKQKIQVDTFSIRRIKEELLFHLYEIEKSDKSWKNPLIGNDCQNDTGLYFFPKLYLKINQETKEIVVINCERNTAIIQKGFKNKLDCIEKSDDQFMKEYALKWIEQAGDCDFQKKILLTDINMIGQHLNMIVPKVDSVEYSLIAQLDSLIEKKFDMIVRKKIDQSGSITYSLSENNKTGDSFSSQMIKEIYAIFEKGISEEQAKKDKLILASMKEQDVTEIVIDKNNNFQKIERQITSSRLNSDLNLVQTTYLYSIKKIN